MSKLIGNPSTWIARFVGSASAHAANAATEFGGAEAAAPVTADQINKLTFEDLRIALRKGVDDLGAARADVIFLCLIYPLIGLLLAAFALNLDLVPLVFPLASGFALFGPMAAVGLYEISRRREEGLPFGWFQALGVVNSPSFGSIVILGLYLLAVFGVWMLAANAIFALTIGPEAPESIEAFVSDVLTTPEGWTMIVVGVSVGFVFALIVLATSVVSFPLLVHRKVGVPNAIVTSIRVTLKNPRIIGAWGLIVAFGLLLGSIPALIGLVVVMPILGHATWHLYRRAIAA